MTREEKKEEVVETALRLLHSYKYSSTSEDFLRNDIRNLVDATIKLGVDVMADVVGEIVGAVFSDGRRAAVSVRERK